MKKRKIEYIIMSFWGLKIILDKDMIEVIKWNYIRKRGR